MHRWYFLFYTRIILIHSQRCGSGWGWRGGSWGRLRGATPLSAPCLIPLLEVLVLPPAKCPQVTPCPRVTWSGAARLYPGFCCFY